MSLRDTILSKQDKKLTPLTVVDWGVTVWLRTWSVAERVRVQKLSDSGDRAQLAGLLCALSICDEHGNRLFSDEDAGALAEKSCSAVDAVLEAVLALNGLTATSIEQAKND